MNYTALKNQLISISQYAGFTTVLFWNEMAVADANLKQADYPVISWIMPNSTVRPEQPKFRGQIQFWVGVYKGDTKPENYDILANQNVQLIKELFEKVNESDYLMLSNVQIDTFGGYGYLISPDNEFAFRCTADLDVWCELFQL